MHLELGQKWNLADKTLFIETHPVDVHVAFWNDVGVEERGFTGCGEREGGKQGQNGISGRRGS